MTNKDRISFQGLRKEYIITRLNDALSDSQNFLTKDVLKLSLEQHKFFATSEAALSHIASNNNLAIRLVAKIAYRFKNVIKRIPFVRTVAIKVKNKVLHKNSKI